MGRQIVSKRDVDHLNIQLNSLVGGAKGEGNSGSATLPAGTQADDYTSKLVKYIPSEVVALYIALGSILGSSDKSDSSLYWVIFGVCLVGTGLYLWRVTNVTKVTQIVISVVAFFVWAFALGGPFESLSWYDPIYGALLLPIYTFFVPMLEP
jgi:hypothetical protein